MKLTRKDILDLNQAHYAFSQAESARTAFELGPKVRYNLARNLRILNAEARDILLARDKIIDQVAPETKTIEPNTEQMAEFNRRMKDFLSETEELDVRPVKMADLNLDKNSIPLALICDLGPVVVDDET